jgi:hypothetical protein
MFPKSRDHNEISAFDRFYVHRSLLYTLTIMDDGIELNFAAPSSSAGRQVSANKKGGRWTDRYVYLVL